MRIAVKGSSGITSIAQLKDKSVATTTGTTSVQLLRKHERANGIDFKEVFGKDHADSFLLLESGRADAFVMDGQILAGNIAKSKNPGDLEGTAAGRNRLLAKVFYRDVDQPGVWALFLAERTSG